MRRHKLRLDAAFQHPGGRPPVFLLVRGAVDEAQGLAIGAAFGGRQFRGKAFIAAGGTGDRAMRAANFRGRHAAGRPQADQGHDRGNGGGRQSIPANYAAAGQNFNRASLFSPAAKTIEDNFGRAAVRRTETFLDRSSYGAFRGKGERPGETIRPDINGHYTVINRCCQLMRCRLFADTRSPCGGGSCER